MKVNSIMVVVAVAIVGMTSGCCWSCSESCKKNGAECCGKQCDIGVKANVGSASADAGVGTSGVHAGARLAK